MQNEGARRETQVGLQIDTVENQDGWHEAQVGLQIATVT